MLNFTRNSRKGSLGMSLWWWGGERWRLAVVGCIGPMTIGAEIDWAELVSWLFYTLAVKSLYIR